MHTGVFHFTLTNFKCFVNFQMFFSSIENHCLCIFRPFWYQWHYNIAESSSTNTDGKHDSLLCCSDFKSFSECSYRIKCWNPEKPSVLICWNVTDEWLYKNFDILYQSSTDTIPNFNMRAKLHAQQFNKEQFSDVLSKATQRFKPGNDRHLNFALTEVHSSGIYCAKWKTHDWRPL